MPCGGRCLLRFAIFAGSRLIVLDLGRSGVGRGLGVLLLLSLRLLSFFYTVLVLSSYRGGVMVGLVFGLTSSRSLLSISPLFSSLLLSSPLFSSPMLYGSWFNLFSTRRRRRVLICIEAVTVMRVLLLGSPGRVQSVLRLSLVLVAALSVSYAAVGVSLLLDAGSVIGCSARRVNLLSVLASASKQGQGEWVGKSEAVPEAFCKPLTLALRVACNRQVPRCGHHMPSPERVRGVSERGERKSWQWKLSLSPLRGSGAFMLPYGSLSSWPLGSGRHMDVPSYPCPGCCLYDDSGRLTNVTGIGRRLEGQA